MPTREEEAIAIHGTKAAAARALGIPVTTLRSRLERGPGKAKAEGEPIIFPPFPEEDVPIEDIINHMAKRFEKRKASYDAHTWFSLKVKDPKPIGLLWMGDPHVDDNGCDWPTLQKHAEICRDTEGLYAVNIGDSSNCWGGRLIRKYADQDTSLKTARRLVEWLLLGSGIRWLVWLYGNHEQMGDGASVLGEMAKRFGTRKVVMHDWEARFSLSFGNGWEPRIFAAHNFAGHSQWNPLHGPMKEGQMGADADLYVCGHLHNWAVLKFENAARGGVVQTFIRTRGYKFLDDYARKLGKHEQQRGQSVLSVFNGERRTIETFEDVEAGADYLTWLRYKE